MSESKNSSPSVVAARSVMKAIESEVKDASVCGVYIYSFNVPRDQLKLAYDLLDKQDHRKLMRVTYNNNHNFVLRYVPSYVHIATVEAWNYTVDHSLCELASVSGLSPPGVASIGKTTFRLGEMKVEPDGGIGPSTSKYPSVVLEVGDAASLTQLEFDASLWIERLLVPVQLVVLISFAPPCPPFPNFPTLGIQLWKRFPLPNPLHATAAQEIQAYKIWEADWTHQATPLYILLSDIFGPEVPAEYGNNDRVFLNSVRLRERILDSYTWLIELSVP